MRTDELHKFSDGMLNDVRTALHDIATGIRMKYLPIRKWSNLEKKRARVMVQDIDKQLYQKRLMRNLEMDIPLDSVVVLRYEKRSKSENKGKVLTEMELVLEQTQQGTSYEVSVFPMMATARRGRVRFIAACSYSTDIHKDIMKAQTDNPVIPTENHHRPILPPSPDYTPASPDYSHVSDSESGLSEDPSSDHIPPLPAILPFLSSDDDTTDSDTPDTPPSPTHGMPFTKITAST
ncbi:hypothetical protein Tco_0899474 [Tanacetum coccineum]